MGIGCQGGSETPCLMLVDFGSLWFTLIHGDIFGGCDGSDLRLTLPAGLGGLYHAVLVCSILYFSVLYCTIRRLFTMEVSE